MWYTDRISYPKHAKQEMGVWRNRSKIQRPWKYSTDATRNAPRLTQEAILVKISQRGDGTSVTPEQVFSSERDGRGEQEHVFLQVQIHPTHLSRFTFKLTIHVQWCSNQNII